MRTDSLNSKILLILLFLLSPTFLLLTFLATSFRIRETWQSFAVVCAKTWDLVVGYIFHFNNFWSLLVGLLFGLALANGFIYLGRQIYKSFALKQKFKQHSLGTYQDAEVVGDSRLFAVTVGFLKPQVYVSSALIDKLNFQELEAVIWHEKYHQNNLHPLFLLGINFITALLFFLPLFKSIKSFLVVKHEILADEFALTKTSKKFLSSALYKIINNSKSLKLPEVVSTFSTTKDRVDVLAGGHNPKLIIPRSVFASSVVMVFIIGLSLFNSVEVEAAETTKNGLVVGQCNSPAESLVSLVTFGKQSEANMTYGLE